MYVLNGIVYGGNKTECIRIQSAQIMDNKIMLLTFTNGETRLFDATILNSGVFERLQDEALFRNFEIDHGVLTWDEGAIDCAPEFMYKHSYGYTPLAQMEFLSA